MSASGKSSNRLSEYNRGRRTGTGHGPYAAAGIRDRERALARANTVERGSVRVARPVVEEPLPPLDRVVVILGGNDSTVSGPPRWWQRILWRCSPRR